MMWEYMDDNLVLFWGGVLSNWYKSDFIVDKIKYNCVEQFMMSRKALLFNDVFSFNLIMESTNPRKQKELGRGVSNFDQTVWDNQCLDLVYPGVFAKFEQNVELTKLLLITEDRVIAEASPYDKIWGIGLAPDNPLALDKDNWNGKNYLGELLMIVRKQIQDL